ncbi:hypothetical protein ACHAXT_011990, partial [Thalassiosira profunda]
MEAFHRFTDETRARLQRNDPLELGLEVDFGRQTDFDPYTKEGRARCEGDGLLIGRCTTLKRLKLACLNSQHKNEETVVCFEAIFRGIAQNRSIEELFVDGYGPAPLTSHHPHVHDLTLFLILAPLFEHNHNLRRIRLHLGSMFPEGNAQLFAAIGKCSSLTDVDFNAHVSNCENYGGEFIAALANRRKILRKLSLKECYHSWNECSDLEDLIRYSVRELDLTDNAIDDRGAAVLGRVLGGRTTLKTLAIRS